MWRIVVVEGAAIGLMSGLLATLLAWPVSRGLRDLARHVDCSGPGWTSSSSRSVLLGWLAISITLGVVASFVPAWHASRHPVREALAHE